MRKFWENNTISFFKKKNSKGNNKRQTLLKLLVKLQQFRIGDPELLDDIQLDIEEGIPLSKTKIEYLKKVVRQLKNNYEKNKNEQQPSEKILDKQTGKV